MPTPVFTVRLNAHDRAALAQAAQNYGAADSRSFTREMIQQMCSGDIERIRAFCLRLLKPVGGQTALHLEAIVQPAPIVAPGEPADADATLPLNFPKDPVPETIPLPLSAA